MRAVRRARRVRAALAGVALVVPIALSGCGEDPPSGDDVRAAASSAPYRVYWVGRSFAGLPLAAINRDEGRVTLVYGNCRPDRDAGCRPRLQIQTTSICDINPLDFYSLARRSRRMGHVVVREYGNGERQLSSGASTILVFGRGRIAQRATRALRPANEPRGVRLLRARYPRTLIEEVRRVRDSYRRRGTVRAVRDELRISQKAIRFRLELADEIGSRRLNRPARSFAFALRDLPADIPVDPPADCAVETD